MSGIGGHIKNFKSYIVDIRIGTAYGEEIELKVQIKPIITNGFPSARLSPAISIFSKPMVFVSQIQNYAGNTKYHVS